MLVTERLLRLAQATAAFGYHVREGMAQLMQMDLTNPLGPRALHLVNPHTIPDNRARPVSIERPQILEREVHIGNADSWRGSQKGFRQL